MPIINKTKEFYPDLPDAEYLLFEDPSVPEGVTISKNNVLQSLTGKLVVKQKEGYWGWNSGGSFCRNFKTPEEAIADYQNLVDWKKRDKK